MFSTKDTNEERLIHSKSDNIDIIVFQSLFSRYQTGLEATMKGSSFVFNDIHL